MASPTMASAATAAPAPWLSDPARQVAAEGKVLDVFDVLKASESPEDRATLRIRFRRIADVEMQAAVLVVAVNEDKAAGVRRTVDKHGKLDRIKQLYRTLRPAPFIVDAPSPEEQAGEFYIPEPYLVALADAFNVPGAEPPEESDDAVTLKYRDGVVAVGERMRQVFMGNGNIGFADFLLAYGAVARSDPQVIATWLGRPVENQRAMTPLVLNRVYGTLRKWMNPAAGPLALDAFNATMSSEEFTRRILRGELGADLTTDAILLKNSRGDALITEAANDITGGDVDEFVLWAKSAAEAASAEEAAPPPPVADVAPVAGTYLAAVSAATAQTNRPPRKSLAVAEAMHHVTSKQFPPAYIKTLMYDPSLSLASDEGDALSHEKFLKLLRDRLGVAKADSEEAYTETIAAIASVMERGVADAPWPGGEGTVDTSGSRLRRAANIISDHLGDWDREMTREGFDTAVRAYMVKRMEAQAEAYSAAMRQKEDEALRRVAEATRLADEAAGLRPVEMTAARLRGVDAANDARLKEAEATSPAVPVAAPSATAGLVAAMEKRAKEDAEKERAHNAKLAELTRALVARGRPRSYRLAADHATVMQRVLAIEAAQDARLQRGRYPPPLEYRAALMLALGTGTAAEPPTAETLMQALRASAHPAKTVLLARDAARRVDAGAPWNAVAGDTKDDAYLATVFAWMSEGQVKTDELTPIEFDALVLGGPAAVAGRDRAETQHDLEMERKRAASRHDADVAAIASAAATADAVAKPHAADDAYVRFLRDFDTDVSAGVAAGAGAGTALSPRQFTTALVAFLRRPDENAAAVRARARKFFDGHHPVERFLRMFYELEGVSWPGDDAAPAVVFARTWVADAWGGLMWPTRESLAPIIDTPAHRSGLFSLMKMATAADTAAAQAQAAWFTFAVEHHLDKVEAALKLAHQWAVAQTTISPYVPLVQWLCFVHSCVVRDAPQGPAALFPYDAHYRVVVGESDANVNVVGASATFDYATVMFPLWRSQLEASAGDDDTASLDAAYRFRFVSEDPRDSEAMRYALLFMPARVAQSPRNGYDFRDGRKGRMGAQNEMQARFSRVIAYFAATVCTPNVRSQLALAKRCRVVADQPGAPGAPDAPFARDTTFALDITAPVAWGGWPLWTASRGASPGEETPVQAAGRLSNYADQIEAWVRVYEDVKTVVGAEAAAVRTSFARRLRDSGSALYVAHLASALALIDDDRVPERADLTDAAWVMQFASIVVAGDDAALAADLEAGAAAARASPEGLAAAADAVAVTAAEVAVIEALEVNDRVRDAGPETTPDENKETLRRADENVGRVRAAITAWEAVRAGQGRVQADPEKVRRARETMARLVRALKAAEDAVAGVVAKTGLKSASAVVVVPRPRSSPPPLPPRPLGAVAAAAAAAPAVEAPTNQTPRPSAARPGGGGGGSERRQPSPLPPSARARDVGAVVPVAVVPTPRTSTNQTPRPGPPPPLPASAPPPSAQETPRPDDREDEEERERAKKAADREAAKAALARKAALEKEEHVQKADDAVKAERQRLGQRSDDVYGQLLRAARGRVEPRSAAFSLVAFKTRADPADDVLVNQFAVAASDVTLAEVLELLRDRRGMSPRFARLVEEIEREAATG